MQRNCSVGRYVSIMGDPWNFLVVRALFFRIRRFEEIQRSLGVSRRLLADRLRRLVDLTIIVRNRYQRRPERFEYRLTPKGFDLYASLAAQMHWGDRWLSGKKGPPLLLRHLTCGNRLTPIAVCSKCGGEIDPHAVSYRDGPGAGMSSARGDVRSRRTSNPEIYERGRACSAARALKIMGNKWAYLVLREAFFGVRRFEEFHRRLGIARNILADRLEGLVANGVLERRRSVRSPDRLEYRLTAMGLDFYPAVLAMMQWGDRWLAGKAGPPLRLIHLACGKVFMPVIVCSACREEIDPKAVSYRDGVGAFGAGLRDPRKRKR